MSSKKKKFEQQIQQNKINRVTNKNAKYNKKMSKSDENYIKGNYTKSVNQTVYGVKKNFTPQLLSFKDGAKVLGTYEDMFGKAYDEELDTATNFKISVGHVLNSIN